MTLVIREISKTFGEKQVLRRIDLDARRGEAIGIMGPSGSGKTTLLKVVADLERPDSGSIDYDGAKISQRGEIGFVFQDHALLPHLTVQQNVELPLRILGASASARTESARRCLRDFNLDHVASSRPEQISGGEAQRASLARALVTRPKVLLLDEPLASLDRNLRIKALRYLKEVKGAMSGVMLVVTHDYDEALALCDRIAILRDGEIEQFDTPDRLARYPQSEFVGAFFGWPPMNFVPAIITRIESDAVEFNLWGATIRAETTRVHLAKSATTSWTSGEQTRVGLRLGYGMQGTAIAKVTVDGTILTELRQLHGRLLVLRVADQELYVHTGEDASVNHEGPFDLTIHALVCL